MACPDGKQIAYYKFDETDMSKNFQWTYLMGGFIQRKKHLNIQKLEDNSLVKIYHYNLHKNRKVFYIY